MKNVNKSKIRVLPLIIAIAIPLLVGVFSAFLTAEDMDIYESMEKPSLSPPGWLFPIVWTILYAVMGTASYFVFASDADRETKRRALTFYVIQLAMNMFWSTLFFTYGRYFIALAWLLCMWGIIMITAIKFWKIHRPAGYMMWALFAWTTFAAYLNLATWIMSI